jgi:hypothetical protein
MTRHVHQEVLDGLVIPTHADVHLWLAKWRGKASDHLCEQCSEPATSWAFDNEQPSWPDERGAYYPDPSRYAPLCATCHARRDQNKETCKNGHRWEDNNRYHRKDGGGTICRACRREWMARRRLEVITND